ncbi:MAG: DUF397 domain-containing protein [Streptosporangiales bacterium]|nr:DUF397 domain-containing protein [Streptosporangiales bacterium]
MDRLTPAWRKSSYSGSGVNCVETGATPGAVLVRDTKNQSTGPVLQLAPAAWIRFTTAVKH